MLRQVFEPTGEFQLLAIAMKLNTSLLELFAGAATRQ